MLMYHKISSILQYCFIYIGQTFAIIKSDFKIQVESIRIGGDALVFTNMFYSCAGFMSTAGADPGFQKGGGGGWMADHIY